MSKLWRCTGPALLTGMLLHMLLLLLPLLLLLRRKLLLLGTAIAAPLL